MSAWTPETSMESVIEFMKKNVVGRTLYSDETLYDLDFGRLVGAYSTEVTLSNLMRSETGFTIDGFTISREKIMKASDPQTPIKDASRVSFFKYEFSKRVSTGEITGFMRFVSSSAASPQALAEATVSSVFNLVLKDDELTWKEDQVLYRDQQNADGSYSPKAFVTEKYVRLKDGKLEYGFSTEGFSVDPRTRERKRTPGYHSPFFAKEK